MSSEARSAPGGAATRRVTGRGRWHGPYPLVLSLVLGVLIWAYVDARRMEVAEFEVPLEIQIPSDWQMRSPPLEMIKVRVRGARQVMRAVRRDRLYIPKTVSVADGTVDTYTRRIVLEASDVEGLPNEVTVMGLDPPEFQVDLARLVRRWVPVEPTVSGKPDTGYTVGLVQADPKGVEVMAPKYVIDKLTPSDAIRTKPVDVTGKRYGAADRVEFEPLIKDGESIKVPGSVYVTVELVEIPSERTLEEKVPVRILVGWPLGKLQAVVLTPPAVSVTVSGPEVVVAKLAASDITVYADVREMVPTGKGVFSLRCHSLALENVKVVKIEPEAVDWRTQAPATAPADKPAPKDKKVKP